MPFRSSLSHAAATLIGGLVAMVLLAGPARADVLDDVKAHGVVKCGVTLASRRLFGREQRRQARGLRHRPVQGHRRGRAG